MTTAVVRDLAEALSDLDPADHDPVVLAGEGEAFSAGGDIAAMADREESATEGVTAFLDEWNADFE